MVGRLALPTAACAASDCCRSRFPDLYKNKAFSNCYAIALFLLNGGEVGFANSGLRRFRLLPQSLS